MAFAELNGVSLHCRAKLKGARPVIAFVNSLGTDFRIWEAVTAHLADYDCVLFDKRGHGLSELGDAPVTIETYAADLVALLDHLGIDKATICGLSIGGLIAQSMAINTPERIERLILCDTAAKIGNDAMWNGRAEAALSPAGIASFADGVMEKWFTPEFHGKRQADLAGYKTMLVRQSPEGYAAACHAIRKANFTDSIASINKPTLVVCGDQDGSTPPDLVRTLAAGIPGARFELIKNAGHIPCVEQPDALVQLVCGFMRAV